MSLTAYRKKRDFTRTAEPRGKTSRSPKNALQFVVQKHDASRLHYDFRLEVDGVLKSWAVPKGPSLNPAKKSLAVQVEDHPLDYGGFEGVIPKGEYGGGKVLLWDTGTWEPLHDPRKGLRDGKLHFVLHGKKLQGEWSLVRMHGRDNDAEGKNWLLMKLADSHADTKSDVLLVKPESVKSGRTIEKIGTSSKEAVHSSVAKKLDELPEAESSALPKTFSPQLALLADQAPTGPEWLHEVKFDGYRLIARIDKGAVRLLTRNGKDWTDKFGNIAAAFAKLKVDTAIVDGEAVVLDEHGRSDFQALQMRLKNKSNARPHLFAFDLPYCNGMDLTKTPLLQRKEKLAEILSGIPVAATISYSDHVIGEGDAVAQQACKMSLEGIISKRIDAPYVSRRDGSWLKSKCDQRQEFIIIGYTKPRGSRSGFGALLLGYHDDAGKVLYAGRVGTGFDTALLKEMRKKLEAIRVEKPPTANAPRREKTAATWVKPALVAEVRFTGWTRDGMLRHPTFIALRSDKPASAIVRERAVKVRDLEKQPLAKKKAIAQPAVAVAKTVKTNNGDAMVDGVKLTHSDRVLYPGSSVTKLAVARYYEAARPWMEPHVLNRPLALVRCPDGLASKCFFQRNWSSTLPRLVEKVDVSTDSKREIHVGLTDFCGIYALVQLSVLEFHAWNCSRDDIEHPDQLMFDLDPGPGVSWKQIVETARLLNRRLTTLKLPTFLKTSGGKGLHLTIPIEPTIDWDAGKSFCGEIAKSLAAQSSMLVANMRKDLRNGKIYVDYHRNGRGATAVAPYSTRAREGAAVSMPISWEELGKLRSAADFTVETASRLLEKRKLDPWRDFARSRVDLRKIVSRESAA